MKMNSRIFGTAAAGCVLGLFVAPRASAAVSDEDFNALKSMVQQLQRSHESDQMQIQKLQQQLGETQSLATNAVEKANAVAQVQSAPVRNALHNFTLVGDAEVQYAKTYGNNTHGGFLLADFAPIFLYRANDNVLFEAGFDMMLNNGNNGLPPTDPNFHDSGSSTSVSISFAQLDYLMNDYMTFVGGYMLLPLGTYSERSAGFLNKIPDQPLGRGFLPGAGAGAQFRGALPLGESGQMITYSVYGANGPSSNGSNTNAPGSASNLDLGGNVGILNSGNTGNLHSAPSGGGRVGWFIPWGGAHKDLEIGVSGQSGVWDDAGNHYWSAGVLDASLHIGPSFELKGEYINTWYGTSDVGTVHPWAVWTQVGYKLAGLNLDLPVINDIELVGRYDKQNDGQRNSTQRYTVGYVYYLTNTLLFEGDYEWLHNTDSTLPVNQLILQLSYGF
jgi:gas vesicle protein